MLFSFSLSVGNIIHSSFNKLTHGYNEKAKVISNTLNTNTG